jgi:hypothetical protein
MEETDVSKFGMDALSKLDIRERHILVSYIQQAEAFRLLQRIMEDALKHLNQKLITASGVEAIVAAHAAVNGANEFYHTMLRMLQEETMLDAQANSDIGTPENPERPVYPAEFDGQEAF